MAATGPTRRGYYQSTSSLVSPESSPLDSSKYSSSTPRYHPAKTQPKSCLAIPSIFRKYGNKQQKLRRQGFNTQQPQFPVVSKDDEDDGSEEEPDWSGPSPQKSLERLLRTPPPPRDNSNGIRRRRGLYDGEMEPAGVRGQEAKPSSKKDFDAFPLPESKKSSFQILRPISADNHAIEEMPSSDGMGSVAIDSVFEGGSLDTNKNDEKRKSARLPPDPTLESDDLFRKPEYVENTTIQHHSTQRQSAIPRLQKDSHRSGRSTRSSTSKLKSPPENNKRYIATATPQQQSARESSIPTLRSTGPQRIRLRASSSRTPTASAGSGRSNQMEPVPSSATPGGSLIPRKQDTPLIHKAPSSGARTATTTSTRSSGHNQSDVESLQQQAMRQVEAGNYEAAVKAFSRVLQSQVTAHGAAHPATASAYHNLGTVHAKRATESCLQDSLQQQSCRNTALECFQAAARSARDSLGPNHPNVAVSLIRVGFILLQSRQYENAVTTFSEALRVRQASFGKRHSLTANVYNNLGVCYMHMDQFEKAWDSLQEALSIQRQLATTQSGHLELADTLFNQGGLCLEWMRRQGPDATRAGQAITALDEAYHIRDEHLGEDHPSVLQVQSLLEQAQRLPVMTSPALSPIARDTSIFRSALKDPDTPPVTHISVVSQQEQEEIKDRSDAAIPPTVLESFAEDISPEKGDNDNVEDESCLISESGVETGQGRIHFPLAWNKAGIHSATGRDYQLAGVLGSRQHVSSPGSVFSTGNRERDDLMNRARSILDAHSYDNDNNQRDGVTNSKLVERAVEDSTEDEVAPLGGSWGQKSDKDPKRLAIQDMLQNPSAYLQEIHNEAARLLKLGEAGDAKQLFDTVLECQRQRRGPLHPDVAAALHNTGISQLRIQDHVEALKSFEEAARIRKGSMGRNHPLVAVSLVKLGITLLLLKRYDEALWTFREALTVRKHALGSLHPSTARIYNNIGCVYVEFSEFKQARRSFEASLDIQRSALSTEPGNGQLMFATATTLCNLGYLYRFRDMHTKAAFVLKEALGMQEQVLGKSHSTVLSTMDNLADSCAHSGNSKEALMYYDVVLGRIRLQADTDKKSRRAEAVLLYKMSRVYRRLEKWSDQLERLTESLQVARAQSVGPSDPLERKILYDIGVCREHLR